MNYKGTRPCMLFLLYLVVLLPSSCAHCPSLFYCSMDSLNIYAIAAGGIFVGLFFARTLSMLACWMDVCSVFVSRHLTLPFVIRRHWLWGPWTRAGVFVNLSYAAINVFLVFFRVHTLTDAGRRAGRLALVNLIFPLSAIHLSYLADLLGIRWSTCCKIHCVTGWMAVTLLSFHIVVAVQAREFAFPLSEQPHLFTMLVCLILGTISSQLTRYRLQSRWPSSPYCPFHGFVTGRMKPFFEGIRFLPGFRSMASGSISRRGAVPRRYISWLHWELLG
jgi:hypothetical protein